MAFADVPLTTILRDNYILYPLASVYSFCCVLAFALLLTRCRQQQAFWRASLSLAFSLVLLLGQPWIYTTPTQPFSIAIASLAMMACWSMLDWGFLQAQPKSVKQVLGSCVIFNTLSGVVKVNKRRLRREAAAAVAAAMPASIEQQPGASNSESAAASQAADSNCTLKHRKPTAGDRPVIHVRAYTSSNSDTPPGTPRGPATPAPFKPRRTTADAPAPAPAPAPGSLLLSSDFTEATSTLASALTCPIEAWLAVLRALVTYDVFYALLSCSSGCLFTATAMQPAAFPASSMGLFGQLLGSKVGYFAFSMAAGTLLYMQMEMGYSLMRAMLLMAGGADLAHNLPLRAFNSPHLASSITDLWGNRWHAFLRFYFEGLGYKLADSTAGPLLKRLLPPAALKQAMSTTRTLVVFAMSGLLHEYLTWAAWGVITWRYMAYFMLHCLALLAEGHAAAALPKLAAATPRWVSRVWALSVMLMLAPLFTETYRQHGYYAHAVHPLLVPVSANILRYAGLCSCSM